MVTGVGSLEQRVFFSVLYKDMASYQMPPPKNFNFSKPEEWPRWLQRFQQFCQVPGLSDKSSENQVNMLVYTMGNVADSILSSFGLSEDDKKNYDTVVQRFERHFVKKRNVIFERAKFNQCKQELHNNFSNSYLLVYTMSHICAFKWLPYFTL